MPRKHYANQSASKLWYNLHASANSFSAVSASISSLHVFTATIWDLPFCKLTNFHINFKPINRLIMQLRYGRGWTWPSSTTAALINMLHKASALLQDHDYVRLISLDFSKAFDTVRHSTLVLKLADLPLPPYISAVVEAERGGTRRNAVPVVFSVAERRSGSSNLQTQFFFCRNVPKRRVDSRFRRMI